jgi:COP9 signalosome complex subunit 8
LPDNLTVTALAQALFNLLASTWERKHARVYSRAQELSQLVTQPDYLDAHLASTITEMIATFIGLWHDCFPLAEIEI